METFKVSDSICMSDEQFITLRDFIYEKSGIFFADNKKHQLESRLTLRLKANNISDYDKYYYILRYDQDADNELKMLFDSVTTNETSFFRSPPQIQALKDIVLPELVALKKNAGQQQLNIWSAGCSTGEEPYTIAMVIRDFFGEELDQWDIKIIANDISQKAIDSAEKGVYAEYALRSAPQEIKDKYFTNENNSYAVSDTIKQMVQFSYLNFSDTAGIVEVPVFDIVFCRNVLIYFDDNLKKDFVAQLYEKVASGGFLFIGHSESLHNISRAFKIVHFPGALGYKKD